MRLLLKFVFSYIFIIVIFICFSSCTRIILNSIATHARELKVFEKDDQKVVYIGTTHLAKPSFFQEVKTQVDSLRSEGFIFFKEGVSFKKDTPELVKDTLRLKFRQLMGLTIGDYTDPNNKSLPRFFSSGDYVMQNDSLIGLSNEDQRVDLTYNELIEAHEKKYTDIILTQCDFETDLFEKYECKDGNAYKDSFYVVDILRTDHLVSAIKNSKQEKIAVVYGAGHFKWLYPDLLKAGYEYKNKRLRFR